MTTATQQTAPQPEVENAERSLAVQAIGLSKSFGERVAVRCVDLDLAHGEIVGLLGGNGAGKTTMFRMLAGIIPPEDGRVLIHDVELTPRSTAIRRVIGLVPQSIALYPLLTARENLRLFGRMSGVPRRELKLRIEELLGVTELTDRGDDPVHTLSGGMARRLNLAAGMVHHPRILLLDEPVVGVDPQSRRAIFALIERAAADGVAVLYTSHQLDEAQRLCDRFVVLDKGRAIAAGRLDDLGPRTARTEVLRIRLTDVADAAAARRTLAALPFTNDVVVREEGIDVELDDPALRLAEVAEVLGATVERIEIPSPSLENLYLDLTSEDR